MILALVEHVQGKLREFAQEQAKTKLNLERQIQRNQRELLQVTEAVRTFQDDLDSKKDQVMKFNALLDPPLVKMAVPMARLPLGSSATIEDEQDSQKNESGNLLQYSNFADIYGYEALRLPDEASQHIRTFTDSWIINEFSERGLASTDRSLADFKESIEDESEGLDGAGKRSLVYIACLAAYCTLLKHITGQEKFVLGVRAPTEVQDADVILGPVSMIPLKVDLSQSNMTFGNLFSTMREQWADLSRRQCSASSLAWRNEVLKEYRAMQEVEKMMSVPEDLNLPVQISYFYSDIIDPKTGLLQKENEDEQEMSLDLEEPFDLKLILCERSDGSFQGGFHYRRDAVDEERVRKWADRFASIIVNIEHAGVKATLASLIGKFYQKVWSSMGSGINEAA
jgi:hypothetical protein